LRGAKKPHPQWKGSEDSSGTPGCLLLVKRGKGGHGFVVGGDISIQLKS